MTVADATIRLGEVFLETADGTRISLVQLNTTFKMPLKDVYTVPEPIKIGSKVRISDDPKCYEPDGSNDGWVDPKIADETGVVTEGPDGEGNWRVDTGNNNQVIAPEHLTVVA